MMTMMNNYTASMLEIYEYFIQELSTKEKVQIEVLNPDFGLDLYCGEVVYLNNNKYIYRSYKSYNDLAELFNCKMLTPEVVSHDTVLLSFKKLEDKDNFHLKYYDNINEKYGVNSSFFRISKNEEPSFLHYYKQALKNVKIEDKTTILNLGINKGDEFALIKDILTYENILEKKFVGVDFSSSAISHAKSRFSSSNFDFYSHDINRLDELNLGRFELIISIGTIQSTSMNLKEIFMKLVQDYLEKKGSIILGFPNCRWRNYEMVYGAVAPNYNFSEQSLLYKDVYFCKKYLQQKGYRVTITGKNYVFLTATSIKK
ncbi:MAG: methyltransferase domain-containing protein [Campylobacterota bacterium]